MKNFYLTFWDLGCFTLPLSMYAHAFRRTRKFISCNFIYDSKWYFNAYEVSGQFKKRRIIDLNHSFRDTKKGSLFEDYVHHVYCTLLKYAKKNCIVEKRKTIVDCRGIDQEIDIYYEINHLPQSGLSTTIRVLIECKNQNRPIPKSDIQAFATKVADIPNAIPVFISASGYQSGASKTAQAHGITLFSEDDLPSFFELLSLQLVNLLLPNSDTQGEPFWILMGIDSKGKLSGDYYASKNTDELGGIRIPLFLSRRLAEDALECLKDKNSFCIRGLTKEHLNYLLDLSELDFMPRMTFLVSILPTSDSGERLAIVASSEALRQYFVR